MHLAGRTLQDLGPLNHSHLNSLVFCSPGIQIQMS